MIYTSRHVLFNESKFPYTLHTPIKSTSSKFTSTSTDATWFSNLLYLHLTNQPSVLGPFPSAQFTNSSSFPTTPHIPFPTSPNPPSQPIPTPTISHPIASSTPTLDSNVPYPTVLDFAIPNSTAPNFVTPLSNVTFPISQPSTQNQHPMRTRSNSGITKPKLCYKAVVDYTYIEPPTYKITPQYPKWCEAMYAEFKTLQKQDTWT